MTTPDPMTSSELYAVAAIVRCEAEERGLRHWAALADKVCVEAALRAVREDEDDEDA